MAGVSRRGSERSRSATAVRSPPRTAQEKAKMIVPAAPANGTPQRPAAFRNSLRFRLGVTLAGAIAGAAAVFAIFIIVHSRGEILAQSITQNQQIAEVIRRSARYAMLQNHREQVAQIIEAVSRTRGIEKIRIFDKEGQIITSTLPREIGTRVNKSAEACYLCHAEGRPLQQLPGAERHRIYRTPDGHRILGTIDVIRNEPACSTATCHAHPAAVTVLGVLDISYSLDTFDARERGDILAVAGITAALAIVIFLASTLLTSRFVYQPLADLEAGARLVSAGDRDHLIPVRRPDEIGHLADSFNRMTLALKNSERDLAEWAHTLEQKVEEKTGELRLAEAKTLHAEKLASVGLLAAGIAHEINNPLTGVLTFAHLVRAKLPEGSPEAEDMDIIIRETKRCAGIIRRLLDFAREKRPEVVRGDLNAVVSETIQFVEHQAGFQNVAFALELDPQLPPVWMDPNQLKQVIMNLLVNARDAMGERGRLVVRSRRHPRLFAPGPGKRAVPAVELTFTDTGCGIEPENLTKIFDPFFTSKEPGKGVGLGLSVGYNIVKAHGGTIDVESEVGRGTTFRIVLPVEGAPPEGGGEEHASQDPGR
jgi:two-component system, NtrC family, sensor kinase